MDSSQNVHPSRIYRCKMVVDQIKNLAKGNDNTRNQPIKLNTRRNEEFEFVSDSTLFNAIRPQNNEDFNNSKWEIIRKLLMRPDAARLVEYGDFILYLICAKFNAPLDIVKTVYYLAPHQALYQDHLLGNTCLHNACLYGSVEVVDFLVKVKPELVTMGRTSSPLHKMIFYHIKSTKKIQRLLLAFPHVVNLKDHLGLTPIQIFFRVWNTKQRRPRSWWQMNSFHDENDDSIHENVLDSSRDEINLINTFLLLMRAYVFSNSHQNGTYSSKNNAPWFPLHNVIDKSWFPLHEAIKIQDIPSDLVVYLIGKFSREISKKDENGNYLLHIALAQRHLKFTVTELIIESNPEVVQKVNGEGRLPLALAIEFGNIWENCGVICKLLKIYPDAVSNPDIRTQLYPFMTALSSEMASTSLVYELLLMDPSLVAIGIPLPLVGKIQ